MRILAFSCLCVFVLAGCQTNEKAITDVTAGNTVYAGVISEERDDVLAFLGIPYAQPPVNELRWKAPQPLEAQQSKVSAKSYQPACFQLAYNVDWYKQVASHFDHDLTMTMPAVSEDCLYLNIWKPKSENKEPLPVMVWIHGGSNKAGWSYEPNYRGHNLAAQGNVIVVSIAYRLGVFGFLAHPQLGEQTGKTNFGLLDQIAALEWIQGNIGYFGGDKNNVTIMGESAGAANVGYLMATSKASGLFHKAISQSGAFQMMADYSLEEGEKLGQVLSQHFDMSIDQLRDLPSAKVWQATERLSPDYDYRALIDDHVFDESPALAFEKNASVNLLIGSNEHEFYMYQAEDITEPSLAIDPDSEESKNALLARFDQIEDKRLAQDWLDTFLYMSCPSVLMADLVNENGHAAWIYEFKRIRDKGDTIKAYHGGEIPYMFDTHDGWLPTNIDDQNLTRLMQRYWSNFAHFGDPNGKTGSTKNQTWPAFDKQSNTVKLLDGISSTGSYKSLTLCQQLWPEYLQ